MAKPVLTLRAATPLLLALLLTACAPTLPVIAPPPEPPSIPALPPQARQPETPSICLPTCSQGLTREREIWRSSLTQHTQQDSHASAHTMR